jgi:hypothetical protein
MGKVNLFPIQHQTSFTITNLGLSTAGQNQMVERTYQTLFFPFFRHVLTSLRLAPRSPRGSSEKAPLCLPEQYVRITFASGSHANGQTVYSGASLCVCVCAVGSLWLAPTLAHFTHSVSQSEAGSYSGPHYHFCLGAIHALLAKGRGA